MVQRIKVTPELRDRAWRDYYERHRRVLTLTEGQRAAHRPGAPSARRNGSARAADHLTATRRADVPALVRDRLTWLTFSQLGVYGYFLYGFGLSVPLLRDELRRLQRGRRAARHRAGGGRRCSPGCCSRRWRPGRAGRGALRVGLLGLAAGIAGLRLVPALPATLSGAFLCGVAGSFVVTGSIVVLSAGTGRRGRRRSARRTRWPRGPGWWRRCSSARGVDRPGLAAGRRCSPGSRPSPSGTSRCAPRRRRPPGRLPPSPDAAPDPPASRPAPRRRVRRPPASASAPVGGAPSVGVPSGSGVPSGPPVVRSGPAAPLSGRGARRCPSPGRSGSGARRPALASGPVGRRGRGGCRRGGRGRGGPAGAAAGATGWRGSWSRSAWAIRVCLTFWAADNLRMRPARAPPRRRPE